MGYVTKPMQVQQPINKLILLIKTDRRVVSLTKMFMMGSSDCYKTPFMQYVFLR